MTNTSRDPGFGALVVTLDFELLWGVRDRYPADGGAYRRNLLGVRQAVPRMLTLFREFDIAVTWATVGALFARSRAELERFHPRELPAYQNARLSVAQERVGEDEASDPLRFALTLIRQIQAVPRQEIGTHTFFHSYALEPGQTRTAFAADLASAVAIAEHQGVRLRSIVFPRNQVNRSYLDLLPSFGLTSYRGNPRQWMYGDSPSGRSIAFARRARRLVDTYAGRARQAGRWSDIVQADGLCDVTASRFLRPYTPRLQRLERLRAHRIRQELRTAAVGHGIYHLWWHPHNFGVHLEQNVDFLRGVLEDFAACRDRYNMRSLSMSEVAEVALAQQGRSAASGGP
jgi:peptidoglycan/xylan/chitin deacetylase (PgdA/CDA1 family)